MIFRVFVVVFVDDFVLMLVILSAMRAPCMHWVFASARRYPPIMRATPHWNSSKAKHSKP
jgi:hypothetical protein